MKAMFAAGRRSLPPVPRRAPEQETTPDTPPAAHADTPGTVQDDGQDFVARLRAAGAEFAAWAGAQTAVVREAVPPARHRRSRCRLVLRYADGSEADLTLLGPVGRPGTEFEAQIQRWLEGGQHREPAWVVPDDDAPDGVAIDVTAWLATV